MKTWRLAAPQRNSVDCFAPLCLQAILPETAQEDADAAFPPGGQGLNEELEKELEAMMDDDSDDDMLFPVELRPGADLYHELDGSC